MRHRAAEAGRDERLGDRPSTRSDLRAVRLAEADAIALGVMNDARLDDVRGEIGERADDPARLDGGRDHAAGIDALEPQAVELAAVPLEIPPGDAVLRADDHGVRPEQRPQARRQGGQAVRLDAEEHDVRRSDRREVAGHLRAAPRNRRRDSIDPQAALLHGAQMRTAREQHDVRAGSREARADVAADRAGAGDDDSHVGLAA